MTPTAQLAVAQTPEEAAYVFLEQARQQVAGGKEITPLAVVVCQENDHPTYDLMGLALADGNNPSAFHEVVTMARKKTAKAIITIVDADYDRAQKKPAPEGCIFVAVSGHEIETVTMKLPFTRKRWRSEIRFGELERTAQPAGPSFLPGWP